MKVKISPSVPKGTVNIPPGKSVMQRICAAALLAGGTTEIGNAGISADDTAALGIIQSLGATVSYSGSSVIVSAPESFPANCPDTVFCGESGLSARMFLPILSLLPTGVTLTGTGSLLKRPLTPLTEILPLLGLELFSNNGRLPVTIHGKLVPRSVSVDGSSGSQHITGLLFAYSAAEADAQLTVNALTSKHYIDITLDVLKFFGLPVPENDNYQHFIFSGEKKKRTKLPRRVTVEGDWSGAAFFAVLAASTQGLTLNGISETDVQPDKAVLSVLRNMGIDIVADSHQIQIAPGAITGFNFDATHCPDLFPPLVALAANALGISHIIGIHRLIHKESNRLLTLTEEFSKLGTRITTDADTMIITPGNAPRTASLSSRKDHRIAMACAVASIILGTESTIIDAEAVNKSYPQFWNHLRLLGVPVEIIN